MSAQQNAYLQQSGQIILIEERRIKRMGEIEAVQAGLPNDVDRKLACIRLSERGRQFLSFIRPVSFGSKGYQKKAGREDPGLSCQFNLTTFAKDLQWRPKDIIYVRDQLVALHIIIFQSDGPGSGTGRIFWNTNLDEWESKQWGGKRQGSGNPQWKSAKHNQLESMNGHSHVDSKPFQVGNETLSSWERTPVVDAFKLGTDACYEVNQDMGASEPLRKVTEEDLRNIETNVSCLAHAESRTQISLPLMNLVEDKRATTKRKQPMIPKDGKKTSEPPEKTAFRRNCLGMLEERSNIPAIGKELGAIKSLYDIKVDLPGREKHQVTFADVKACFEDILIEPQWDQAFLSLQIVKTEIVFFLKDPVQFRLTKQRKRDLHNRLNGNGQKGAGYARSTTRQSSIQQAPSDYSDDRNDNFDE